MDIKNYARKAMSTCMDTSANAVYMLTGLVAEVGEFCGKVAKAVRKGKMEVRYDNFVPMEKDVAEGTVDRKYQQNLEKELKLELGDILWFVAGICAVQGWDMNEIAKMNLSKLAARKVAGTIEGSGDGISKEERSR